MKVFNENDTEPFEVNLPASGKKVALKLLRVADEREILRYAKRSSFGVEDGDPGYIYRIARHIVSIDGEELPIDQVLNFCEELIGKDSTAIQIELEKHDCGLDLTMHHSCNMCGSEFDEVLPLTAEFFRPGIHSRR